MMREIINGHQAAFLSELAACDSDKSRLIRVCGVVKAVFMRNMPDLRERGLVETYLVHKKCALQYSITMAGRRALADHIKHHKMLARQLEKAQPARRNLFEFPVWVPPRQVPTRNDGNRHIASVGVRC